MFLPTCLPSYKSPCLSLNCCACLCVLWDETYYPLHSLTVPSVTTTCYPTCLPTCFQLISLSSLHYRASFRVCSMWHGEQGFFPLPFLSLLVHLFFLSAFFTLITVVISGCFWDPRFSLPPMCSNLCPYSANFSPFSYSILLSYSFYSLRCCFCLGFRTFRCFGAINITESIIYVPSVTLLQCSSFHSLLSLPVTVILPGCFWAQDTLRGARWQRILLASHLFPYLSPCLFPTCFFYFSISIAILLSGWIWSKESPRLLFLSLHCSLFFVLVALGTGLKSHLFSYSSLYFTLTCGCSLWVLPGDNMLLVLCLSPCLSPLFSPTRALTSLFLSLSLSLFFSLGASLDTWFSSSPICLRTCLPCSLQVVSLIASPLLFFSFLLLGCFLYLSLNCCACLCMLWDETYYPLHSLTLGHYHMLPYLTSYLSPTCLLIISPLPCFFILGRRGEFFSSFRTCSSSFSQCFLRFSPH